MKYVNDHSPAQVRENRVKLKKNHENICRTQLQFELIKLHPETFM